MTTRIGFRICASTFALIAVALAGSAVGCSDSGSDGESNGDEIGSEDSGSDGSSDSESGSTGDTESTDSSSEEDTTESTSDDTSTEDDTTESSTDDDTSDTSDTSTEDDTTESDTTDDGTDTDCVPDEMPEVTCDGIDNDCNGEVDDVDVGNDGICDCLAIGIIGDTGFQPNANFEAWLDEQGTSVSRTIIQNQPGIIDAEFLAQFDILIVDRIQRSLSAEEAAAIEAFVKDDSRGVLTLIGYNFDNNNPGPERDRANSVLTSFGLAYVGGYLHAGGGNNVAPTFDQNHPIGMGIFDTNYIGGIEPVDNGNQGTSEIFATVPQGDAGLAHESDGGGRVIVWGDEWITFDSDWQGYADVEPLWANMIDWVRPQDICSLPQ